MRKRKHLNENDSSASARLVRIVNRVRKSICDRCMCCKRYGMAPTYIRSPVQTPNQASEGSQHSRVRGRRGAPGSRALEIRGRCSWSCSAMRINICQSVCQIRLRSRTYVAGARRFSIISSWMITKLVTTINKCSSLRTINSTQKTKQADASQSRPSACMRSYKEVKSPRPDHLTLTQQPLVRNLRRSYPTVLSAAAFEISISSYN